MTTTGVGAFYHIEFGKDVRSDNGAPCVVATDPALPGAIGYGDTEEEAAEMLHRSRLAVQRTLFARNETVPYRLASGAIVSSGRFSFA